MGAIDTRYVARLDPLSMKLRQALLQFKLLRYVRGTSNS